MAEFTFSDQTLDLLAGPRVHALKAELAEAQHENDKLRDRLKQVGKMHDADIDDYNKLTKKYNALLADNQKLRKQVRDATGVSADFFDRRDSDEAAERRHKEYAALLDRHEKLSVAQQKDSEAAERRHREKLDAIEKLNRPTKVLRDENGRFAGIE